MVSPWAGLVVSLTFCYRICRSIGRSSSTISVSTQQRRSQKIVEGGSVRQAAEGGNSREASFLGGSRGMPPQKYFDILDALRQVLGAFSPDHLDNRTDSRSLVL